MRVLASAEKYPTNEAKRLTSVLATAPVFREVRCVECGEAAVGPAFDWGVYLSGGYENEPVEVVVFCPGCALRESDLPAPA